MTKDRPPQEVEVGVAGGVEALKKTTKVSDLYSWEQTYGSVGPCACVCVYERERFFRIKGERGGEVFIDEFLEHGGSEVSWGRLLEMETIWGLKRKSNRRHIRN